jgi:antitoxin (DNA-binding transcriptional repressor) of toxin-antitoxin stability system
LAETEDIIVTKNNKPIAKLTNIREDKLEILDSLIGIIPNNGYTLENAKNERLARQ